MGINPNIVRVFFVLLAFGNGVGILLYILLWLIIPLNGKVVITSLAENVQAGSQEIAQTTRSAGEDLWQMVFGSDSRLSLLVGAALVLVGLLFLLPELKVVELSWLNFDVVWPILLIIGGLVLLLHRPKGVNHHERSS